MTKPMLKLVPQISLSAEYRQVPRTTPLRRPNKELRSREYLTATEMDSLLEAARRMRHGQRDSTMLLIAYRHGFRAAEIVDLRWDQIDLDQAGSSLVARRLCGMPRYLVGSPTYLDKHGRPRHPLHLAQHRCMNSAK